MKDRVSLHPNRYKLTPVSGQANTYDLSRADEPLEAGTPITKATMFDDVIADKMGLTPENGTPNNGFKKIDNRVDRLDLFKIGDIRTTVKDDLGDDYLLCNGSIIKRSDYPELCQYNALQFAKFFSGYTVETGEESNYNLDYCTDKLGAVYVDGKWVFAGNTNYYGRIVVTENPEDESSWQVNKLNYSYYLNDICYGGKGVWVVSRSQWNDYDACVMIANDPLGSWTTKSISDISAGNVGKIATNGNGVFCAVADRGYSGANQHRIVYSLNNGATWTCKQPVTSGATINWKDIAYGNGMWVMIGSKTEYLSGQNRSAPIMAYATAPNATWTLVTLEDYVINGGDGNSLTDIIYANGKWLITAYRNESIDGSYNYRWYFTTFTFDNNSINAPKKMTMDLGVHYSYGINDYSAFLSYHSLIYCNDKFVALGDEMIFETDDPTTGEWTMQTIRIGNTSESYSMQNCAMTDGTRWLSALGSYGYVTSECRHLPTISMDDSYTYIKAKESNDGYK